MRARRGTTDRSRPTLVYMHVADGEVVYVGVSNSLRGRTKAHQKNSHWWPTVDAIHVVSELMNRDDAEAIEARLIATLNPVHNLYGGANAESVYRRRGETKRLHSRGERCRNASCWTCDRRSLALVAPA